ncbi:MAG: HAD-IIIC family phosphatase [Myxococcales bacterium FL481]|nr:MAG: HAD-IIIC family phosphatase [Myxococcales bacterium FL481]
MEARGATSTGQGPDRPTITLTATFTAEPIADALRFWGEQLELAATIEFAPYNQVFQTLLDPQSVLRRNRNGVNVVLLRFADWEDGGQPTELADALRQAGGLAPLLVVGCPVDTARAPREHAQVESFRPLVADIPGAHWLSAHEVVAQYPVHEVLDPHAETVGHVPYTREYFAALGTAVMRRISAIRRSPYKVIALDCDNTLWRGIVGEDGVDGIAIDDGHVALQRFMVDQHDAGKLLCLASKNNAADVNEVFDRRSMPLNREHLVAECVDWNPKPHNLRHLAEQLSLGLDSFVFFDDSAVECAQMQQAAPEVLTLQVPASSDELGPFVEHVWALDQLSITDTDRRRTAMYRENRAREQSRSGAASLAEFLASLELVVDIDPLAPDELPRASQLTQRTNQFNFTTIRRSEPEVAEFTTVPHRAALRVQVSDRFGEYGFVGLLLLQTEAQTAIIDTFLLSCRALGRGVEHRMLAAAGTWARQQGCSHVVLPWKQTRKNAPARAFFDEIAGDRADGDDTVQTLRLATDEAAAVQLDTRRAPDEDPAAAAVAPSAATAAIDRGQQARVWQRIATSLRSVDQILAAMQRATQRERDPSLGDYEAPQSELEQAVVELWTEQLGLDRVSRDDPFLALGGTSLAATRIISRIRNAYGVEVSLVRFFDTPTVAGVAAAIEDLVLAELEAE